MFYLGQGLSMFVSRFGKSLRLCSRVRARSNYLVSSTGVRVKRCGSKYLIKLNLDRFLFPLVNEILDLGP